MYEKSAREHESGGTARYAVCYTEPDHGRNGTDSPFDFLTINYIVPVFLCTLAHIERERGRGGSHKRTHQSRTLSPNNANSLTVICYLLTPWSRVLLEKLASLQLVKNFPAFYGNRRFLTALTSARHLSLSWASPIQFSYPYPTSWRSILILSSHLRLGLPGGLFPSGFPTKFYATGITIYINSNNDAIMNNN